MKNNPSSILQRHRAAALREKFLRETETYLGSQLRFDPPQRREPARKWRNRLHRS